MAEDDPLKAVEVIGGILFCERVDRHSSEE
jgi:hypothetical protein